MNPKLHFKCTFLTSDKLRLLTPEFSTTNTRISNNNYFQKHKYQQHRPPLLPISIKHKTKKEPRNQFILMIWKKNHNCSELFCFENIE